MKYVYEGIKYSEQEAIEFAIFEQVTGERKWKINLII